MEIKNVNNDFSGIQFWNPYSIQQQLESVPL